jgi:hypothetical protein
MKVVRGQQATLENDAIGRLARSLNPQVWKGILKRVTDFRAIKYLPILEIAATAKADSASADAAKRTRDAAEVASSVDAWEADLFLR